MFDAAYTPACNPMQQLGALGWFFYWIVIVSGIYLYIFFDTGISQAYQSVEYLTHEQWYAGGIMRSLHRYASDALVVVVFLHLLREFVFDRFRGPRWFAWVTGILLLWLLYASGISGYWVIWDKMSQYIAIATTEWFDSLGIFGKPIARNFLNEASLSGRFFTLMIFIHIAAPLMLLFGMWVHIQRHMHPQVNPPRALAAGCLVTLLILSLWFPAFSHGPANLDEVPSVVNLDWFYLVLYPLLDDYPGALIWAVVAGSTVVVALLPWLPARKKRPVAVVHLDNCNGCARCAADCPYSAITMVARTDGQPFEQQASVNPALCLSCGICTGACPSASPFRRRAALVPGIELPVMPILEMREKIQESAAQMSGDDRILVFNCEYGLDLSAAPLEHVVQVTLPCVGMLPPSMIDYTISRNFANGVFIAGCREHDCNYRLGNLWTRQRLARERDPYLRERVPAERLAQCWAGVSGYRRGVSELEQFQRRVAGLGPLSVKSPASRPGKTDTLERADA
jgi:ferredoxin/coenzyme F420-reducing hydrogenase delta subunit